jgi:hypothetical protein
MKGTAEMKRFLAVFLTLALCASFCAVFSACPEKGAKKNPPADTAKDNPPDETDPQPDLKDVQPDETEVQPDETEVQPDLEDVLPETNPFMEWEFADGELTISGNGPMPDYTPSSPAPWMEHRNEILSCVIEEGITAIGTFAFSECESIISITLPHTINSIGEKAFLFCFGVFFEVLQ